MVEIGTHLLSLVCVLLFIVLAVQLIAGTLSQGHALIEFQQGLFVPSRKKESPAPDHMKFLLLEDATLTGPLLQDMSHLLDRSIVTFRSDLPYHTAYIFHLRQHLDGEQIHFVLFVLLEGRNLEQIIVGLREFP